jgi:ParB family chromosome partitioning protein
MPTTAKSYEAGKLYQLDLARVQNDPNQPRKYIDPEAMEEMTASVARHGVLQPIILRTDGDDSFIVVAGERRVAAARKAGLAEIPAIFVDGNPSEIALVENLLRQDLNPIEEAEALDRLIREQSYTHEQLAGIIGKARNTLTEILSLNRLPVEVRDECRSGNTASRKALIEIARKKQERSMITAWNHYKDKLARAAEGRKKRVKEPERASDIINWMKKTVNKLEGLNTSAWSGYEANVFMQTLASLDELIQNLLPSSKPADKLE